MFSASLSFVSIAQAVASRFSLGLTVSDINNTVPEGNDGFLDLGDDGLISNIGNVLQVLYAVGVIICVIIIILAGYQYFFSRGEQNKSEAAKKAIINACIGLAVIIFAFIIQNTLIYVLNNI